MWKLYALLSALFAAMTAIFTKIGVKEINSDWATAIRTTVILVITWGIVLFGSHIGEIKEIPRHSWLFLVPSAKFQKNEFVLYLIKYSSKSINSPIQHNTELLLYL